MAGALLPAVVIFEESALPNSGQRYLTTPAELPSINAAVGQRACVRELSSFAARYLARLRSACLASNRAHFPLRSV